MSTNSSIIPEPECDIPCLFFKYLPTLIWPSMVLYMLVQFVMIKCRGELNSSFFAIAISCGFADIVYFLHTRLMFGYMIKWFFADEVKDSVIIATCSNMGNWGFYYVQVLGVLLIAMNRHTAMVLPLKYSRLWRNMRTSIAISLQWLLPALLVFPMAFVPGFQSEFDEDIVAWLSDPKISHIYWTGSVIVECFFFAPLLILLYVYAALVAYKHTRKVRRLVVTTAGPSGKHGSHAAKPKRTEVKLSIVGGLLSLIYVSIALASALYWLGVENDLVLKYIDIVWLFVPDIFTGINPIFMLLFAVKVRKCFVKTMSCKTSHANHDITTRSPRSPRKS